MNFSEENDKQGSSFKDIEVHDTPNPSSFTFTPNIPQSQTSSPGLNLQAMERMSFLEKVEMHARIVKWTSLVLSIFAFLFLLPGTFPLIVTFVFPIVGFVAAHKYNDCMAKFYSIYLILINIVQIIVMGVIGGVAYIVFQVLVMLAEVIILVYNIKLTREIASLSQSELDLLKGIQARNFS